MYVCLYSLHKFCILLDLLDILLWHPALLEMQSRLHVQCITADHMYPQTLHQPQTKPFICAGHVCVVALGMLLVDSWSQNCVCEMWIGVHEGRLMPCTTGAVCCC